MINLPKVKKTVQSGLSKMEKVRNVVAAVALAAGVGITGGGVVGDAEASLSAPSTPSVEQGAVLLVPAIQSAEQLAYHYSHRSHASHASHSSHQSHYSSRW